MSIAYRRSWSSLEDHALTTLVQQIGQKNWSFISSELQKISNLPFRSGKQCRERWYNHLDPNLNKSPFTPSEDETIFSLYKKFGKSWSAIANFLPGRSDNSVKNRFYSALRRNLRKFNKSKPRSQRLLGSVRTILRNFEVSEVLLEQRAPARERGRKSGDKESELEKKGFFSMDDVGIECLEDAQLLYLLGKGDQSGLDRAKEGFDVGMNVIRKSDIISHIIGQYED